MGICDLELATHGGPCSWDLHVFPGQACYTPPNTCIIFLFFFSLILANLINENCIYMGFKFKLYTAGSGLTNSYTLFRQICILFAGDCLSLYTSIVEVLDALQA